MDLGVRLQGAGNGILMRTTLWNLDLLPTVDPYGSGEVMTIDAPRPTPRPLNPLVRPTPTRVSFSQWRTPVDWVRVELRDANDPSTVITDMSAILLASGRVVDPAGRRLRVPVTPSGSYHIVVFHRSHLPVASPAVSVGPFNRLRFYFGQSADATFSGFHQVEIDTPYRSRWAMYAGNGHQQGADRYDINFLDIAAWQNDNGLWNQYLATDYNMDGDVNSADRILVGANNGLWTGIPQAVDTPSVTQRTMCFVVADGLGNSVAEDQLLMIDVETGEHTQVGTTTTSFDVEASTFSANGETLFAVDGDTLGTIDIVTGQFQSVSESSVGGGDGSEGPLEFTDLDGLTYDRSTDTLFASVRRPGPRSDLLIKLDPTTGQAVANAFGVDVDYLAVPTIDVGENEIDGLAADPVTGNLYAAANSGGAGGTLITIDKITGAVNAIALLATDDIEGLSIVSDGATSVLYGSTGNNGPITNLNNKLLTIDPTTGLTSLIETDISSVFDWEALACRSVIDPPAQ